MHVDSSLRFLQPGRRLQSCPPSLRLSFVCGRLRKDTGFSRHFENQEARPPQRVLGLGVWLKAVQP